MNQEIDLSRQYSQEKFDDQGNKIWYIKHEQLNNTRWKTSLFIKVNLYFESVLSFIFSFSAYPKTFI